MTTKFANYYEAIDWFDHVFDRTARIVSGDCFDWVRLPNGMHDYQQTYAGREWFKREFRKHKLHPAVMSLMRIYKPDMWQQLLLEWPHKAETDPNRLAYTRDERSGEQDRQVVTTIGKYLRRHFSHAPDDMIRDIVAEHTYGGNTVLVTDMDKMIDAVVNGPRSCMSKDFSIRVPDGTYKHPYAVYDPDLGWAMAVRYDTDGSVLGRCLVWRGDHDNDADFKCFVRSYKRERNELSHSGADEAIEAWLKSQGYVKEGCWPDGTPLMRYTLRNGGYLMPYIDGGTQRVDEHSFTIDDNGDIEADNTDGIACEFDSTCEHCGARFNSDDEGAWVGPYEDTHICGSCVDNDYTYVYGRRGNQYYVHNNDVVEADGECYHDSYLGDNNIVYLEDDGEYTHVDNAVWIESADAYYHVDSNQVCYDEDAGEYDLKDNCWQCAESGNWYNDGVDYIEIDGNKYHPDHAPETETTDDDSSEAA